MKENETNNKKYGNWRVWKSLFVNRNHQNSFFFKDFHNISEEETVPKMNAISVFCKAEDSDECIILF